MAESDPTIENKEVKKQFFLLYKAIKNIALLLGLILLAVAVWFGMRG